MRGLDLGERGERDRIKTADGVGELRREHGNALALRHAAAACADNASPAATSASSSGSVRRPAADAKPFRMAAPFIARARYGDACYYQSEASI